MIWKKALSSLGVIGVTIAVHEAAHALAAARAGGRVREVGIGFGPVLARTRIRSLPVSVRALPLGGYAHIDVDEIPPRRRVPLLLAGPLANIALGSLLLASLRRHPLVAMGDADRRMGVTGAIGTFAALVRAAETGPGAVGRLAGAINVGLGVMNLMPVYPLDGGHIVTSLLEARGAPQSARALFAWLTAAAFAFIVQRAMAADLRRLAKGSAYGR